MIPEAYIVGLYDYSLTAEENMERLTSLAARLEATRMEHKFLTHYNRGVSESAVALFEETAAQMLTMEYGANYYTHWAADDNAVRRYTDGTSFYLGKFTQHHGRLMPDECFIDSNGTVWTVHAGGV